MSDSEAIDLLAGAECAPCAVYDHGQAVRLGLIRPGWRQGLLAAAAAVLALLLPAPAHAQEIHPTEPVPPRADTHRRVTGVIRDSAGVPLSRVMVRLEGTSLGMITAADGRFALPLPPSVLQARLSIARIGYMSARLEMSAGAAPVAVTLQPSQIAIEGIVINPIASSDAAEGRVKPAVTRVLPTRWRRDGS